MKKWDKKPTKPGTWLGYDFPYIGNVIIPADELILFRGVGIPPTGFGRELDDMTDDGNPTNQLSVWVWIFDRYGG